MKATLIEMATTGRKWLLHEGYTFFYRYKLRVGHKWVCTNFPRCKAYLCVTDSLRIFKQFVFHPHEKRTVHKCADGKYVR
ncbi:hypothetical protein evm_005202 [Chilo suppressalis]|nr:hypothetical protein evm_005202 [Chilo suppressalis]